MQAKTMGSRDVNALFTNVSLGKNIVILCNYILLNKFQFLFPVKGFIVIIFMSGQCEITFGRGFQLTD